MPFLLLFFLLTLQSGLCLDLPPSLLDHHSIKRSAAQAQTAPNHLSDTHTRWLKSSDYLEFNGISQVSKIQVPIVVNIVPIGFDLAHLGVKLDFRKLREWLQHLDHTLPDITFDTLQGQRSPWQDMSSAADSIFEYYLQYHLVDVSTKMIVAIERILSVHARPTNNTDLAFQVDPEAMSTLLDEMALSLNLAENSFTIFVLNPHFQNSSYGYRYGLSNHELDELLCDGSLAYLVESALRKRASGQIDRDSRKDATKSNKDPLWSSKDCSGKSELWINQYLNSPQTSGPQNVDQYLTRMLGDSSLSDDELTELNLGYLEAVFVHGLQVQEDCLVDTWVGRHRSLFIDLAAGPFVWGPSVTGAGFRSSSALPKTADLQRQIRKTVNYDLNFDKAHASFVHSQFTLDKARQQAYVLKEFLEATCSKEQVDSLGNVCDELTGKYDELSQFIEQATANDLFEFHEDQHKDDSSPMLDNWLSQLSAAVSSAVRHVIVPPFAFRPVQHYSTVVFDFYMLTSHESYDPGEKAFSIRLKQALAKLAFPGQEFSFTYNSFDMAIEPLSVGLTRSFKTATVDMLKNGKYTVIKSSYIDSLTIQHYLSLAHNIDGLKGNRVAKRIPIFVFSMQHDTPVYVDKYFQSRATHNMVIAVQNKHTGFEGGFLCNGKSVRSNLRDPVKSIVSSVSELLTGMLPFHVGVSPTRTQQYRWEYSTGLSPSSWTSQHYVISEIQQEAIRRHLVLSHLNRALASINASFVQFSQIQLTSINVELSSSPEITRITTVCFKHYDNIIKVLKQMGFIVHFQRVHSSSQTSSHFAQPDKAGSFKPIVNDDHLMKKVLHIESLTQQLEMCNEQLINMIRPSFCKPQRHEPLGIAYILVVVYMVLFLSIFTFKRLSFVRRRRHHIKVN